MSSNKAKNILVFDIEGTDCNERGDERGVSKFLVLILFRCVRESSLYLDS